MREHPRLLQAARLAHPLRRGAHVRRVRLGSPARRSAKYASTVVERSPGPPWKFVHVPSARCWERIHAAERSVPGAVRIPRNSRSRMSSASIVTFVCSSPRHQPVSSCKESRCSQARSSAIRASLRVSTMDVGMIQQA